ncbi:MAG TPA: hypothetical protein VE153_40960 [Myxococcus sp.]|nr:hypothetical protein [Myxococcus sp.]
MTPARLLFLQAALLTLAGCADDSTLEERERCARSVSRGLTQAPTPLLVVGRPATVKVSSDTIPSCLQELEPTLAPEILTAQVYGPDNTLVPSDIQLNAGRNPWTATLRFTPPSPGAYHAIVSFSPVGGLQQFTLLVGTDRTETPAAAELDRTRCDHVDRTTRGTWVCDGSTLSPGARTWQSLGVAPKVAVAGDVVWVTEMGRVRRFVDTGTSLELTATLSLEGLGGTSSRLATEDELVMLDTTAITRVTFAQGQGLTAWPPFRLPSRYRGAFGSDFIEGLLLRSGERLLWVTLESASSSGGASSVCPLQLGAEGGFVASETPCQRVPGTPVGSEPGVLWLRTGETDFTGRDLHLSRYEVRRWVARDGVLEEEGVIPLRNLAFLMNDRRLGAGPVVPTLLQPSGRPVALPVWSEEPGVLGLELFNGASDALPFAGPRFFWTRVSGTTLRVVAR